MGKQQKWMSRGYLSVLVDVLQRVMVVMVGQEAVFCAHRRVHIARQSHCARRFRQLSLRRSQRRHRQTVTFLVASKANRLRK